MKVLRGSVFRLSMTLLTERHVVVTPCKLDFRENFAVNVKDKVVGVKIVEWSVMTGSVCT